MIGGILARYQELLGIELFAYGFLGNHFHLLARAPRGNMDEFCENVNREIARRINWKLGRRGTFWGRRYDDQEILSEEDAVEAFLYINTNPSRHGLIADSSMWPGLISYSHAVNEQDPTYGFCHHSKGKKITWHMLRLSILPIFSSLSKEARRRLLKKLLRARTALIHKERRGQFLGVEAIYQQPIGGIPKESSRSKRPPCFTGNTELRRVYRERSQKRRSNYLEASRRYRLGLPAEFPEHSYFPPRHRRPRSEPFKELNQESVVWAA